jgi:phosphatidylglycerol:prolipoprotein diacylglycerol transferase
LAAIAFPAIDPIAFRVGPFAVRWYGIAYLLGFLGAYLAMRWLVGRWKLNISDDDQLTIVLAAVVGVVVGGRLGYVIFYGGGYYWSHPAQIGAVWDGGMSFHGGLIGILVAAAVVAATMKIPWLTLCDIGSVGAPIGIFFGRLANFVNQELWGRVTTVPWGVVFPGAGSSPRHPSQLYEALLEGALLFLVMLVLSARRRPLPRGVLFGVLLSLYGAFRISVEVFREPDAQIGFLPGGLTMGQALSAPLILGGVALVVWSLWRDLPQRGRP